MRLSKLIWNPEKVLRLLRKAYRLPLKEVFIRQLKEQQQWWQVQLKKFISGATRN